MMQRFLLRSSLGALLSLPSVLVVLRATPPAVPSPSQNALSWKAPRGNYSDGYCLLVPDAHRRIRMQQLQGICKKKRSQLPAGGRLDCGWKIPYNRAFRWVVSEFIVIRSRGLA